MRRSRVRVPQPAPFSLKPKNERRGISLFLLKKFGGVPEWPKGSDCKSDGSAFGGSNPPPSTKFLQAGGQYNLSFRGYGTMVAP